MICGHDDSVQLLGVKKLYFCIAEMIKPRQLSTAELVIVVIFKTLLCIFANRRKDAVEDGGDVQWPSAGLQNVNGKADIQVNFLFTHSSEKLCTQIFADCKVFPNN